MNRRKFMGMVGVAAVTPALTSAKTDEPKLFALLHDGHFSGDSSFYFPSYSVPYTAGMSLDDIKRGHLELVKGQCKGQSPSDFACEIEMAEDTLKEAIGAIIVGEKVVEAMDAIWESDPGCDSAVYNCNRAAKRVAWKLKTLTVGKGMYE